MDTHYDDQHTQAFMDRLRERAEAARAAKASMITGGGESDVPLAKWNSHGVHVQHMPSDEQGILRISIGGGQTPVPLNYCVFRGNLGQCIELLELTLAALRDAP